MEQGPMNRHLVPLAIVVAGAFIAAAIYFGGNSAGTLTQRVENPNSAEIDVAPVTAKDHILGSSSAELVIVEYSDTECPFCKVFHQTMQQVVRDYAGKVSWVYRHFPIVQLHAKAPKEAEATECANELGGNQAFWKYIDKLFLTTNSNDSLDASELPKIATAVGLNESAFNTCLSSGRHAEFVSKSVEEAVKAGARGTPYSVIITRDGEKVVINGAEPIDMVKSKIDALLR